MAEQRPPMATRKTRQPNRLPVEQKKHSSPDVIEELAQLLPGSAPVQERVKSVIQQTHFKGPIPHPDIFKGYAEVIPDAPERILKVFEADSAHTRNIQSAALEAEKQDNQRTHWMAWSLIAMCMGLALIFAVMKMEWLAGAALTAPILGAATAFLRGRNSSDDDDVPPGPKRK